MPENNSEEKPRQPEPKYDALPDCDPEVLKAQEAIARIMQERDKATKKRVLENVLLVLRAELAKAQNRGELEVIRFASSHKSRGGAEMTVCDKKCEICTIGTAEKCGLCAPECNKEILVQRAADGAATAESDVNYRLHATFGAVASNQVKDVMDLIVKVVAFEITAAEKRGEERGRAKEAAKYKAVVEAAGRIRDVRYGRALQSTDIDLLVIELDKLAALEEAK